MNDAPTLKQIKQRQKPPIKVNRQKKLSQALRENLAKRKAQLRERDGESLDGKHNGQN